MSDIDTQALEQVVVGMADPEIVSLEARIRAAQLSADITALNDLISDDLLFTGPDGQLGTKAQDMEAYRSGVVKFLAHVPQELRIRRVGANVAIASLRAHLTVDVAGNIARGMYRYTRVWAREDDKRWRVVGGHVSLVNAVGDEKAGEHETSS
jgi:ketosteroid isomerase-like protein